MATVKTRSRSKPAAPTKPPAAAPKKAATDVAALRGELRQLAAIRARFAPLAEGDAAALLAHHDAEACREKGRATRAPDTFRGAMSWARTFGEHADDPALSRVRVRWFLDCLTVLGALLTGRAVARDPSAASRYDDAARAADRLLARTERRARDAAGTSAAWHEALDDARAPDGVRDDRVARLTQLADRLDAWLAAAKAPPLGLYDVTAATVADLRAAARALDDAIGARPAPQQPDRDTPAVNEAEGRLYHVMRPLWDDLAEAREDGRTSLQLTVSPALLRGLNLNARRRKDPTG